MNQRLPVPDELLTLIEKREQPDRRRAEGESPAAETPPAPEKTADHEDPPPPDASASEPDRRKVIRRAEDRRPTRDP